MADVHGRPEELGRGRTVTIAGRRHPVIHGQKCVRTPLPDQT
jgi:hypothetical protein